MGSYSSTEHMQREFFVLSLMTVHWFCFSPYTPGVDVDLYITPKSGTSESNFLHTMYKSHANTHFYSLVREMLV